MTAKAGILLSLFLLLSFAGRLLYQAGSRPIRAYLTAQYRIKKEKILRPWNLTQHRLIEQRAVAAEESADAVGPARSGAVGVCKWKRG